MRRVLQADRIAAAFVRYTRGFGKLTATEWGALVDFADAVGAAEFEFTDGSCGPITGWLTVRFESFVFAGQLSGGQRHGATLIMRGLRDQGS